MWSSRRARGVTLFESLVTLLLLFVVLSSVVSLLQSSLRAVKGQQGRPMTELAFMLELIRRDLADALHVDAGMGKLQLQRNDYSVAWQDLLEMKALPKSLKPLDVTYQLTDGFLKRQSPMAPGGETLMALEEFFSEKKESDVRVGMSLTSGQRKRNFVWNFRCPAL